MALEIDIAKTLEQKKDIFRFRYKIYVEELNRPTHADHVNKMVYDEHDDTGHLFYAKEDDRMIGTARVNLRKEGPIEFENEYEIMRFAPYFPDQISTTSKLMYDKNHRASDFGQKFLNKLYNFGRDNGVELDFINFNGPLLDFYKWLGYRGYKENISHPEYGEVIPMVLVLNDLEHLNQVHSPFAESARRYNEMLPEKELLAKYIPPEILNNNGYQLQN